MQDINKPVLSTVEERSALHRIFWKRTYGAMPVGYCALRGLHWLHSTAKGGVSEFGRVGRQGVRLPTRLGIRVGTKSCPPYSAGWNLFRRLVVSDANPGMFKQTLGFVPHPSLRNVFAPLVRLRWPINNYV